MRQVLSFELWFEFDERYARLFNLPYFFKFRFIVYMVMKIHTGIGSTVIVVIPIIGHKSYGR